jgi:hypothetical protein
MKSAAPFFCLATAISALLAGVSFFFDPSHSAATGSDAYWKILAEGSWGRTAFIAAFAAASLLSLGAISAINEKLMVVKSSFIDWLSQIAWLGFAVHAVSYIRLLGGEEKRAQAYITSEPATQQAIASFSLVLDTFGLLTYGGVGLYLLVINIRAWLQQDWNRWVALIGSAFGLAYITACAALIAKNQSLVSLSVAVGGIGFGPLWWICLSRILR